MPLAQLPPSTVKLIGSSQVITSVSSVVKELMENSIDSGASSIEIKLDKHGLDKIEVKDDGCGIGKSDALVMCLSSYTSKISEFSDLDRLASYGFRGEALGSVCNVAQVTITTKSAEDDIATCYTYDHNGHVVCSKASHIAKGTIVIVTELFKNLPVRRQFMSNTKRAAEELKKVEKIVKSLAMIHPRLRVSLVHNKFLIWQKSSVANLRQSVMQVISLNIVKQLHHILHNSSEIRVEMMVPSRDCNVSTLCYSNFTDAYFLFINNRPVRNKEVERAVYNRLFEYFGVYMPANKNPVCVTSLTVAADSLDVNLEPDKSRIYFKNHDQVVDIIQQCLHLYYGDKNKKQNDENSAPTKANKKRKVEGDCLEGESKKIILREEHIQGVSGESASSEGYVSQSTSSAEEIEFAGKIVSESPDSAEVTDDLMSRKISEEEIDNSFIEFCLEKKKNLNEVGEKNQSNINNNNEDNTSLDQICNEISKGYPDAVQSSKQHFENFSNEEGIANTRPKHISSFFMNKHKEKNGALFKALESNENQNDVFNFSNNADSSVLNKENADSFNSPSKIFGDKVKVNEPVVVEDSDEDVLIPNEKVKSGGVGAVSLTGISSPTLSQWSRGDVLPMSSNVEHSTPFENKVTSNKETLSPLISQNPSNRSVSSQMGCKEMSAFTKFARKMRKQILEEQPGMSFTRVAQQLQNQWRDLDADEKKKYEQVTVVSRVAKTSSTAASQKTLTSYLNKQPDIVVEVTMERLRTKYTVGDCVEEAAVHVVGRLEASPLWLYHSPLSGLSVFSVLRLQEAVRFHNHLATLAVPSRLLDQSIPFTSSDLGEADWRLLLSLERSPNGVIKDDRLVSNGFIVEIVEGEALAQITYVPLNISYCGVEELQEVMGLLRREGPQATLAQCRPLKVISFIRSEVMRECCQLPPPTSPEEVSALLSNWLNNTAPDSLTCIHHQPVSLSLETP